VQATLNTVLALAGSLIDFLDMYTVVLPIKSDLLGGRCIDFVFLIYAAVSRLEWLSRYHCYIVHQQQIDSHFEVNRLHL
jgi:predicted Co/Zn/Cd cation transporter (cation efflux family)